ncbi:hypothetical protein FRC05_003713, partial [Tulasnella sp. 425]
MSESRSNIELQSSWPPSSGPAIETNERQSANQPRGEGITMKDVGKANIAPQNSFSVLSRHGCSWVSVYDFALRISDFESKNYLTLFSLERSDLARDLPGSS